MGVAVTGSEAEGLYEVLRGVVLHSSLPTSSPPPKKIHHAPSSTISHPSPQESKETEASVSVEQALESTSSTTPSILEGEIPAKIQPPLYSVGGYQKSIQMSGWGLQGGPINLSCYHLQSCVWGTLGSGVGVPPLQQIFLQP